MSSCLLFYFFLDIRGAQQPPGIIDPKFLAEVPLNPIPRVPRARTKKARELNPHTPLVATQQPAGIESAGWLIVHTPDKSAPQLKEQTSRPNKGVYCVALPTQWNCNMHAGFTEHGWGAVQHMKSRACTPRLRNTIHVWTIIQSH